MMANASFATDKQHGDGGYCRHRRRIMAGTARERYRSALPSFCDSIERYRKSKVATHGWSRMNLPCPHGSPPLACDPSSEVKQLRSGGVAQFVIRVAHIECEIHFAWNHVACPRQRLDFGDCGHEAGTSLRKGLHIQNE